MSKNVMFQVQKNMTGSVHYVWSMRGKGGRISGQMKVICNLGLEMRTKE